MFSFTPNFGPKVTICIALLATGFTVCNATADVAMMNNLSLFPGYSTYFNLDADTLGLNTAISSVGLVAGGAFTGPVLDRFGRVRAMMLGCILFMIGTLTASNSPTDAGFCVGRFIFGFAQMISQTTCPVFLMEIVHPRNRTTFVGLMAGFTVLGAIVYTPVILGLINYESNWAWKGYIMGELIPPFIGFFLCFLLPETPRWLVYKGRADEALEILTRLHAPGNPNDSFVQLEYREICEAIALETNSKGGWKGLVYPASNLRRFLLAVATNIFTQTSGAINVLFFMSSLLLAAGIQDLRGVVAINVGLFLVIMIGMVTGGKLLDTFGRRRWTLVAQTITTISTLMIGIFQRFISTNASAGYTAGAIIFIYIFQYSTNSSWNEMAWTYPNELLKFEQRAKGLGIAQAVGFAFSFIWLYCYPIAVENIGWKFFIINAAWNFVGLLVIYFFFIETNGLTLEEVDCLFDSDKAGSSRLEIINGRLNADGGKAAISPPRRSLEDQTEEVKAI